MQPRPAHHILMGFILLALATLHTVVSRQPDIDFTQSRQTVVLTIPPVILVSSRS